MGWTIKPQGETVVATWTEPIGSCSFGAAVEDIGRTVADLIIARDKWQADNGDSVGVGTQILSLLNATDPQV